MRIAEQKTKNPRAKAQRRRGFLDLRFSIGDCGFWIEPPIPPKAGQGRQERQGDLELRKSGISRAKAQRRRGCLTRNHGDSRHEKLCALRGSAVKYEPPIPPKAGQGRQVRQKVFLPVSPQMTQMHTDKRSQSVFISENLWLGSLLS